MRRLTTGSSKREAGMPSVWEIILAVLLGIAGLFVIFMQHARISIPIDKS